MGLMLLRDLSDTNLRRLFFLLLNHLQFCDPTLFLDSLPIGLELGHFVLDFLITNFLICLSLHDLLLQFLRNMRVRTVADLGPKLFTASFVLMKFVFTDHSSISSDFGRARVHNVAQKSCSDQSFFFVPNGLGAINLRVELWH